MMFLILYALVILAFTCWVLGWCSWHAYLVVNRFFKTHQHKHTNLKL